jgi:hypothetical protein
MILLGMWIAAVILGSAWLIDNRLVEIRDELRRVGAASAKEQK